MIILVFGLWIQFNEIYEYLQKDRHFQPTERKNAHKVPSVREEGI